MKEGKTLKKTKKIKKEKEHVEEKSTNRSNSEKIKLIMKSIRKTHSLRPIMNFVKIFRAVLNEENNETIVIEEGDIFNDIMKFALTVLPEVLKDVLALPEDLKTFVVRNKKLEIILKVFLSNLYKFICKLQDEEMIVFILKLLPNISELIIISNTVLKSRFIKHFIELWSTNDSIVVKLNAFILLRNIATLVPEELEFLLKKTYAAFVKSSKNMNWRTYESIMFMMNCYSELLGIDYKVSYMVAFNFINQKATMLKKFFKEKNASNIHNIYNWQFINSLKLWMRAVVTHYNDLGELVFPLIYICEGILELYQVPKYFPLFIQIIKELNNISRSLGIYISTTKTMLFTLLSSKELNSKKSNKKPKAFDFDINIKVSKEHSQTNTFWNAEFNEILDLLVDFLAIHSKKIFFPEITNFLLLNLKKLQKKYTFNFYKMKIKLLLQKIHEDTENILTKRNSFDKPVTKKADCLNFESHNDKSALEEEYERSVMDKENIRKQKILAEKEENEKSELLSQENEEGLEEGEDSKERHKKMQGDLEKPLSEEEDLDLD